MLHRRPTTGGPPSGPPPASSASYGQSSSGPTVNKAYTPLRRQSNTLYPTPGSGPRARYSISSPSNSFVSTAPTGSGAAAAPTSLDLGVGGFGSANGNGYGSRSVDNFEGYGDKSDLPQRYLRLLRDGMDKFRRGAEDALRLDRSWNLVWGDAELRNLVLKSTLINFLALLLLSLSSLIFSPLFPTSPSRRASPLMQDRTREIGVWYNLLLSWPVLIVCFLINASWGPDISRRAQVLLHPAYRHQPTGSSTPTSSRSRTGAAENVIARVFAALTRIVLIADFTLMSRLIALIPLLGRPTATAYMCLINAYYCFEWTFTSKGWPLEHRVTYLQERAAYMLGFGLPITLLSSFAPQLINTAVFAVIYPFFVVQALLSRPPTPRDSLLPSTPSPHASLPGSPTGGNELHLSNPFFGNGGGVSNDSSSRSGFGSGSSFRNNISIPEARVPVFFFARYVLEGLAWLETAVMRDRGGGPGFAKRTLGKERPGKRLM